MLCAISSLEKTPDNKYVISGDVNGELSFYHYDHIISNHITFFKNKFVNPFLVLKITEKPIIHTATTSNNFFIIQTTEDILVFEYDSLIQLVDQSKHDQNRVISYNKTAVQNFKANSKNRFKIYGNSTIVYFSDDTSLCSFNTENMDTRILLNINKPLLSLDVFKEYVYIIDENFDFYRKNLSKSTKVFTKSLGPLIQELGLERRSMPVELYVSRRKSDQIFLSFREFLFFINIDLITVEDIFEAPEIITTVIQDDDGDIVLGMSSCNIITINNSLELKSCVETNNPCTFSIINDKKNNSNQYSNLIASGSNGIIDVYLDNLYAFSFIKPNN